MKPNGPTAFDGSIGELRDDYTRNEIIEELQHLTFKRKNETRLVQLDKGTRDFLVDALKRQK